MTTATQLETIQTAVVGVGGYSGMELARLLLHHPRLKAKPPVFAGRSDALAGRLADAAHRNPSKADGQQRLRLARRRTVLLGSLRVA